MRHTRRRRPPKKTRSANAGTWTLLTVGVVLTMVSIGLAHSTQIGLVNPGGGGAWIRDYPNETLALADAGEPVVGKYVGWTVVEEDSVIEDYTSRGRMTDQVMFSVIELPEGTFTETCMIPVDFVERAIFFGHGDLASAALVNSVNGAFVLKANATQTEFVLQSSTRNTFEQIDETTIEMSIAGHTFRLEIFGNGTLEASSPTFGGDVDPAPVLFGADFSTGPIVVDEVTIEAVLDAGSELRGWIDNEYPVTTNVTHSVLGNLTTGNMTTNDSGQGCPPPVEGDDTTEEEG